MTPEQQRLYNEIVDKTISGEDTAALISTAVDSKFAELAIAAGVTPEAIAYVMNKPTTNPT